MTSMTLRVPFEDLGKLRRLLEHCGFCEYAVLRDDADAIVRLREDEAVRAILLLLERGVQVWLAEACRPDPALPRPRPAH